MSEPEWDHDSTPSVPGWYPTTHCWDVEEGIFPSAYWWTGAKWTDDPANDKWWTNAHVAYWPVPCASREEALALAEAHDLEWRSAVS